MALVFAPGTDFEDIVDGAEAVTVNHRDGTTTTSVTNALQRAVNHAEGAGRSEQDTFGKVKMGDVAWHLPVAEMTTRPELGATIQDANANLWEVLGVEEQTLSRRWRCVTREIAITVELDTSLLIERGTFTKGVHGESTITWSPWKTVRAHIQPISTDPAIEDDAKLNLSNHIIYVEADLDLGVQHRFRDKNGEYFNLSRVLGRKTLGELMRVETRQTPFPIE